MRARGSRARLPGAAGLALAFLALTACSPAPSVERDAAPPLQTDTLSYRLSEDAFGYRTTIAFTYRNETGAPVWLANCEGDVRPLLEMERGGIWFPAWEPYRTECASPPVVIPPGSVFADTLHLRGAPPGSNMVPAFVFPEVEGVYRMVWFQAYASWDTLTMTPGDRLPLEERVSNPFVLLR